MLEKLLPFLWMVSISTMDWLLSCIPFLADYDTARRVVLRSESACYRRIASDPPPPPKAIQRTTIHSLPIELIGMIFSYACDPRSTFTRHQELSSVCRRFRIAALTTPGLWTSVHVGQSPKWWSLQVERSKATGLHICFSRHMEKRIAPSSASLIRAMWCRHMSECACFAFLAFFAPYMERWESFSFQIHHITEPSRLRINALLGRAYLPELRLLEFIPQDVAGGFGGPVQTHFCDDWETPNLTSLVCTDEANQSNTLFALQGHAVKSLSVRASHPQLQPKAFRDVLQVASMTMLMVEYLLLTFDGNQMSFADPTVNPEPMATTFSHLRVLSLHLNWRDIQQPFVSILPQLYMPTLELLLVKFQLLYPVFEAGDPFDMFGLWIERLLRHSRQLKDIVVVMNKGRALSSDEAESLREDIQSRISRIAAEEYVRRKVQGINICIETTQIEQLLDSSWNPTWRSQRREGMPRRGKIISMLCRSGLEFPVRLEELAGMRSFQFYPNNLAVPDFHLLLLP